MSRFETSDTLKIYFKQIKNSTPLTEEEEKAIGVRIANGDTAAINHLVNCNLKLVVTLANKFIGQGLSIDDLIQEGNIGLYEAASKYKADKGKFSNYAAMWIRKRINEAIAQKGRLVRLPHNQEYDIYKAKKRGEEVANLRPVELDAPVGEDADESLGDKILGETSEVEHTFNKEHDLFTIRKSLNVLKERDREIVKLYFGIDCETELPSDEIAERMGMTQIRVCQIVKTSLGKMKEKC